ncbi:unnamed protein product [Allacma fusca]|uniref:TP53-regulated inhibitor of apoptosis 1 n=1 Tax=Allacma fusca TaxID=39272 RepID=A0A8J2JBF4_9HEXA|nr:unnamed protein product [Allacma fusca]
MSQTDPKQPNQQASPQFMNSISEECNMLKYQYDECFNNWFSEKFLQGNKDLSVCDPYMKLYSECVRRAMLVKGIDTTETDRDVLKTDSELK